MIKVRSAVVLRLRVSICLIFLLLIVLARNLNQTIHSLIINPSHPSICIRPHHPLTLNGILDNKIQQYNKKQQDLQLVYSFIGLILVFAQLSSHTLNANGCSPISPPSYAHFPNTACIPSAHSSSSCSLSPAQYHISPTISAQHRPALHISTLQRPIFIFDFESLSRLFVIIHCQPFKITQNTPPPPTLSRNIIPAT